MKSKITALIKLARAGGSTFAREWLATQDPDGYQRVVINADNIRLELYDKRYCSKGEGFVHATEDVMIRSLMRNENQHLLLDDTHTTISSIRKVLQVDPDARFIYINTPVDECERRALATGQNDLVEKGVIRRMHDNLVKLCNYTIEKRVLSGYDVCDFRIHTANEDDIMMSVEDIRQEVKNESGT